MRLTSLFFLTLFMTQHTATAATSVPIPLPPTPSTTSAHVEVVAGEEFNQRSGTHLFIRGFRSSGTINKRCTACSANIRRLMNLCQITCNVAILNPSNTFKDSCKIALSQENASRLLAAAPHIFWNPNLEQLEYNTTLAPHLRPLYMDKDIPRQVHRGQYREHAGQRDAASTPTARDRKPKRDRPHAAAATGDIAHPRHNPELNGRPAYQPLPPYEQFMGSSGQAPTHPPYTVSGPIWIPIMSPELEIRYILVSSARFVADTLENPYPNSEWLPLTEELGQLISANQWTLDAVRISSGGTEIFGHWSDINSLPNPMDHEPQ